MDRTFLFIFSILLCSFWSVRDQRKITRVYRSTLCKNQRFDIYLYLSIFTKTLLTESDSSSFNTAPNVSLNRRAYNILKLFERVDNFWSAASSRDSRKLSGNGNWSWIRSLRVNSPCDRADFTVMDRPPFLFYSSVDRPIFNLIDYHRIKYRWFSLPRKSRN